MADAAKNAMVDIAVWLALKGPGSSAKEQNQWFRLRSSAAIASAMKHRSSITHSKLFCSRVVDSIVPSPHLQHNHRGSLMVKVGLDRLVAVVV